MFEFLLALAFVIAFLLAYFFFKTSETDTQRIVTKLEFLNKVQVGQQSENIFSCKFEHSDGKVDELLVIPTSMESSKSNSIGIIPYDYKPRILHYMNTPSAGYRAEFDRTSEKLTIDLLED